MGRNDAELEEGAPHGRRSAAGELHRARRDGDRERREPVGAGSVAPAYRRGLGRRPAPDRTRPARRDPAAARLPRDGARRAGSLPLCRRRTQAAGRQGHHRVEGRDRRPTRDLPRHSPGDPLARRARPCIEDARPSFVRPGATGRNHRRSPAGARRGSCVLRGLGGAHERGQARAGLGREHRRRRARRFARARDSRRRRRRRGSRRRHRPHRTEGSGEALGGRIGVESPLGHGTSLVVTLPVGEVATREPDSGAATR